MRVDGAPVAAELERHPIDLEARQRGIVGEVADAGDVERIPPFRKLIGGPETPLHPGEHDAAQFALVAFVGEERERGVRRAQAVEGESRGQEAVPPEGAHVVVGGAGDGALGLVGEAGEGAQGVADVRGGEVLDADVGVGEGAPGAGDVADGGPEDDEVVVAGEVAGEDVQGDFGGEDGEGVERGHLRGEGGLEGGGLDGGGGVSGESGMGMGAHAGEILCEKGYEASWGFY